MLGTKISISKEKKEANMDLARTTLVQMAKKRVNTNPVEDKIISLMLRNGYVDFDELARTYPLEDLPSVLKEFSPSLKKMEYSLHSNSKKIITVKGDGEPTPVPPVCSIPNADKITPIQPVESHSTASIGKPSTTVTTATEPNNEPVQVTTKVNADDDRYKGETPEERERRGMLNRLNRDSKKLHDLVLSNVNPTQQYQTLVCTFNTSAKHQTTNIKEFSNRLDNYMEKLSEKLKLVTVTHKSNNLCRTYSYEHFTVISVIGCTARGYLHAHCVFVFEGCINKIAPKKLDHGIGFDFDSNPVKECWKYGDVHIEHFLTGKLEDSKTLSIGGYFCENYRAIRGVRMLSNAEIMERAKDDIDNYIAELKLEVTKEEKEQLVKESYTNLCDLKEQQSKGKRNRLIIGTQRKARAVQPEDISRKMSYKKVHKYVDGMTLVDQHIRTTFINLFNDNELSLQISIINTYSDNTRTYANSVNMFSYEDYKLKVAKRREPVLLDETPVKQQLKPSVPPPVDVSKCEEDSYTYMKYCNLTDERESLLEDDYALDDDGYYDSVPLGDDEEVQSLYADENGFIDSYMLYDGYDNYGSPPHY
jgi:hypothetical protein